MGLTGGEKIFVAAGLKLIPVLVSFFHFHTPCFDFGPFLGMMPNEEKKKPIRFPDAKFYAESFGEKMFKNNHYFRSLKINDVFWPNLNI